MMSLPSLSGSILSSRIVVAHSIHDMRVVSALWSSFIGYLFVAAFRASQKLCLASQRLFGAGHLDCAGQDVSDGESFALAIVQDGVARPHFLSHHVPATLHLIWLRLHRDRTAQFRGV